MDIEKIIEKHCGMPLKYLQGGRLPRWRLARERSKFMQDARDNPVSLGLVKQLSVKELKYIFKTQSVRVKRDKDNPIDEVDLNKLIFSRYKMSIDEIKTIKEIYYKVLWQLKNEPAAYGLRKSPTLQQISNVFGIKRTPNLVDKIRYYEKHFHNKVDYSQLETIKND